MTSPTLERVLEIVAKQSGVPVARLSGTSAVDQDIGMARDDVTDLADALASGFGEHVWTWPWQRFALLDELGVSPLFPVMLLWRLLTWPFRASFNCPSTYGRLEPAHIAAVIDRGEWFEP